VLADSWRCLDPRYERIAACLGLGPWRRLVLVRLQLLRPALLFAGALGVAVSLSLYLPTLLLSGGRLATLATEAVALGAGGDRRVMGVHGSLQAVLAWLFFAWAALASHRHHRKTVRR
jgi:putative thiamine transport system permease protein